MNATQIAPLNDWKTIGPQIGVTWRGREYTDDQPVVSTYIERAYAENPNQGLYDLMIRARVIMANDCQNRERSEYYADLPKRGEAWTPDEWASEETVVWTVRHSNGNHHAYHRDLTAGYYIRDDGAVIPTIRNGLGDSVTETIMVCVAGTNPTQAIRQLISTERRLQGALASLDISAAQCQRYAK